MWVHHNKANGTFEVKQPVNLDTRPIEFEVLRSFKDRNRALGWIMRARISRTPDRVG